MSQQLIPVNGGTQTLQTSVQGTGINVPSVQYILTKHLENRPTEWVAAGRPIYRRLPAVSDTYQINFFDIVPIPNTAVRFDGIQDVGYVYIPWGEGIFGPVSLEVVSSESRGDLIVKSGQVVWKYGTNPVLPAIINLKELGFGSGRYLVAYQLVYDNAPFENYYAVEDFALTGSKLLITSSSDNVIGWRYPAVNAFLNSETNYWSNQDSYFPSYAQPSTSFIQWESNDYFQSSLTSPPNILPSAYSKITLRCPASTVYTGSATLSYVVGSTVTEIGQVSVSKDSTSQYFEFTIQNPNLQVGWRVDFTDLDMKIQAITVSGVVTKITQQAEPTTRCALCIYPENAVPTTIIDTRGVEVPATYCRLAIIDVDSQSQLIDIQDIRPIIHRDYKPIAEWLTRPFDEDLISLYEQVQGYSVTWMSPTVCMSQEYVALETYGVELT